MRRSGITICHIKANLACKLFKKSPQDYNKSEAEELNEAATGMFWHHVHFSGIWLKQNTLRQLTRYSIGCLAWKETPLSARLVDSLWWVVTVSGIPDSHANINPACHGIVKSRISKIPFQTLVNSTCFLTSFVEVRLIVTILSASATMIETHLSFLPLNWAFLPYSFHVFM